MFVFAADGLLVMTAPPLQPLKSPHMTTVAELKFVSVSATTDISTLKARVEMGAKGASAKSTTGKVCAALAKYRFPPASEFTGEGESQLSPPVVARTYLNASALPGEPEIE